MSAVEKRWPFFPIRGMVAGFALVLGLTTVVARATHTKEETDQPDTDIPANVTAAPAANMSPKATLRAFDAALPAGGMKAAEAAYYCTNDKERRIAHVLAEVDLATARLEHNTRAAFGAAAVDALLHAARNVTLGDLQEADEKIDGDQARIIWKAKLPAVPLIRVDGEWKVSIAALLKDVEPGATIEQIELTERDVAAELQKTADEVKIGKYANATLLQRAVSQRMYRVLGDEDEKSQ